MIQVSDNDAMRQADVYLIVIRDVLIAEDLRQSLCEMVPDARVVIIPAIALAQASIAGLGRVAMAVFDERPALVVGSALWALLREHAARLVFAGDCDAPAAAHHGAEALPYPFSTQDVHSLITRAAQQREG